MSEIYDNMPSVIDARQMLINMLRSKGIFVAMPPKITMRTNDRDSNYCRMLPKASSLMTNAKGGTPIRVFDKGRAYFMPVWLKLPGASNQIEIPVAAISIKGRKTIIETPLVGRSGSVKELISIDDYEVSIDGIVISTDRNYPEDGVSLIRSLFNFNGSIELISAVSDIVIGTGTQIVIKSIEWPKVGGVENMQAFSLTAVTDTSIELEIK